VHGKALFPGSLKMNVMVPIDDVEEFSFHEIILKQGELISDKLNILRHEHYPPNARKGLRQFSLAEVAGFLGVSPSNIKKLHLEGKGPTPTTSNSGRRSYTAEQMLELRLYLDRHGRADYKRYVPHRRPGESLQTISIVNFKGGSGKTTTAAHLAQHLALTGHRVLAIDLDPQASLSALHGVQPELDKNPSLYDAIRYEDEKRPIADVIRSTNFPGLDVVPANLELQEYEYETPLHASENSSGAGRTFFTRISDALKQVDDRYDVVVIDCPPQLGYLTLTALTASTAVLVTIHPQMLDVMSMSQFLLMLGGILKSLSKVARVRLKWFRYLVTRYEPTDGPQSQMVGFMQTLFPTQMLDNRMVKSTAISDAGITNQTLYEVDRSQFTHATYDRAMEALSKVNQEITELINKAWGRK
jgi:chromosome partitioning protein